MKNPARSGQEVYVATADLVPHRNRDLAGNSPFVPGERVVIVGMIRNEILIASAGRSAWVKPNQLQEIE